MAENDVIIPGESAVIEYDVGAEAISMMLDAIITFTYKDEYGDIVPMFEKTEEDCEVIDGHILALQLYEDDTLQFPNNKNIRTQVHIAADGYPRGISVIANFRTGYNDRKEPFYSE